MNSLEKEDALISVTASTDDWKLVHEADNIRIFQSAKDPSSFKLFGTFTSVKPLELFQVC